ncbi:MAG TPA: Maf family nucleotide pyrophosphatase [Propylenella sp.]|nr:Maf family nucleotide pyrophosphatase [Propylenella sp.]
MTLVLASASPIRRQLLANAGLSFEIDPADIDERAAEEPLLRAGATPEDLALALAMAKAASVSERRPGDLVIGADQVLDFNGERLTKPADMQAARRQLLRLAGRTHRLRSAIACARGGEIAWHSVDTATLKMRALQPAAIWRYLAKTGESALQSVGAYQLEGVGVQLFQEIDGDYFAMLGLPLLPLLEFLRSQSAEGVLEC